MIMAYRYLNGWVDGWSVDWSMDKYIERQWDIPMLQMHEIIISNRCEMYGDCCLGGRKSQPLWRCAAEKVKFAIHFADN